MKTLRLRGCRMVVCHMKITKDKVTGQPIPYYQVPYQVCNGQQPVYWNQPPPLMMIPTQQPMTPNQQSGGGGQSYSTLLKFGTVNDLICVFCDFINMQRILVVPGNLLYISYGPCTRISVRLCYLVHCLQIGTIVYSYYVMLASFIFRLWILLRPTPRSSTVFSIMIAIAIPPALVLLASVPPALGAFCSLYYIEPYRRYISGHYS
ncbi:hypothetical protein PRIPAC_91455, partial [Pristionchus pacificus]|uniref:G protein-coupled receptor n=1 Tax=Pristionchus pacificus TaxID=54126 RepID=A0A2A6CGW3_PRIPA